MVRREKIRRPSGRLADAVADEVVGRDVGDVLSLECHGPHAGMEEPADRLEGRGLAGAVCADQRDDLAAADLQGDPAQGMDRCRSTC